MEERSLLLPNDLHIPTTIHPGSDYISAIPDELFCQIISLCDILDVLRIRGCSRRFRSISLDREVWLNILLRFGKGLRIALPTAFSFNSMSTPQLERLAKSHIQFQRRVRQESSSANNYSLSYTSCRTIPFNHDDCLMSCIRFIPGGRYLLTLCRELKLWDLGSEKDSDPRVLTSCIPKGPQVKSKAEYLLICTLVHDSVCEFCVLIYQQDPHITSAFTYQVNPTDPSPEFHCLGSVEIHAEINFTAHLEGKLSFVQDTPEFTGLGIYDMHKRVTFSLFLPNCELPNLEIHFADNEKSVVVWAPAECFLKVFNLPDVTSFPQNETTTTTTTTTSNLVHLRHMITLYPVASFFWEEEIVSIARYALNNATFFKDASIFFDIIHLDINGPNVLVRRELSLVPSISAPDTDTDAERKWELKIIHVGRYSHLPVVYPDPVIHAFFFPHDQSRVLCWVDEGSYAFRIHLSNTSMVEGEIAASEGDSSDIINTEGDSGRGDYVCDLLQREKDVFDDEDLYWLRYSFAPLLGRLAVSKRMANIVEIYEYLP